MKQATVLSALSLAIGLAILAGTAAAASETQVNCNNPSASIQDAVNNATGPTTIIIKHTCVENVTVTTDDLSLQGKMGTGGTVSGTITFDGAQRGVVQNLTVTGSGAGIIADHGASVRIQDNVVTANGDPTDNYSPGIGVFNGASAQILGNSITDNTSDGVGVFTGATAEIRSNTISGNGRLDPHFEAGIQVGRAHVRGQSNIVTDNPYGALGVFNDGSYRTGSFLTSTTLPDNDGPFEVLDKGASGQVAVDIGQMSYVDLRQVDITGDVSVGFQSMLQVRGDNVGDSKTCSTINGNLAVFGFNSGARLRFVNVTGSATGTINGSTVCP